MEKIIVSKLILIGLLAVSMASCQQAAQTTQPFLIETPTAEILPTDTPVLPSDTPAFTDTPEPLPTATPVPSTPTLTAQAERPVQSIDELVGVWKGYWSNINMLLMELKTNKQSTQKLTSGEFAGLEWFDFADGLLRWGKMIKPMNAAQKCVDNPEATYKVFITFRGELPEKLRFELVGEDQCYDRQEFLDGKTLTWVGNE